MKSLKPETEVRKIPYGVLSALGRGFYYYSSGQMERKDKKDFRLYLDSIQVVKQLTKEEAGEFLLSCIAYWEEEEKEVSRFTQLAFANTKAQFDRDFDAYIEACEKNKKNGEAGGRPKKTGKTQPNPTEPKKPTGFLKTQPNPKNPDTDTDTDTDTDNHTDTNSKQQSIKKEKTVNTEKIRELLKFSEDNPELIVSTLITAFVNLGWNPVATDNGENLRAWLKSAITLYDLNPDDIRGIIFDFETYWANCGKSIRNHKSTFINKLKHESERNKQ